MQNTASYEKVNNMPSGWPSIFLTSPTSPLPSCSGRLAINGFTSATIGSEESANGAECFLDTHSSSQHIMAANSLQIFLWHVKDS